MASLPRPLADLLGSIDFAEFAGNKWGKECHSSRVSDDLLEKLREGFCNGDFAEVAARCRKDDNSLYSNEEIGDMEQQLESKMTINLPFCYSRGALQIKQCFIEQDKLTGNDVEVLKNAILLHAHRAFKARLNHASPSSAAPRARQHGGST